jgi:hypothetical protein
VVVYPLEAGEMGPRPSAVEANMISGIRGWENGCNITPCWTAARWGALVDLSASVEPCCRVGPGVASLMSWCGGDDVGSEVSAFRSRCSTEILCACSADTRSTGDRFELQLQGRAGE